tara:strand:- start:10821 stop:11321 length:501 start_codon:yes stop_codon:yes gene_type:complete
MAFKLITPVSDVLRRDFPINTTNLSTDPTDSSGKNAKTIAGCWVAILEGTADHVAATGTYATDNGAASAGSNVTAGPMRCVFTQKGDTASQALNKITVLWDFGWEAETSLYAGNPAGGDLLTVNSDGKLAVTSDNGQLIVAMCTKGESNSKITFQALSPFIQPTIS